jgi:hypothetical protein
MSTTVYRVQNFTGRGPFKPGVPAKWSDENFAPGMEALPTWMEEFGADAVQRLGRGHEHFGSAVRHLDEIGKWFSPTEQQRLERLGYHVVFMRVDRILAESDNQLLFARDLPLWQSVTVVRFPAVPLAALKSRAIQGEK